jgi:hypothetical protein
MARESKEEIRRCTAVASLLTGGDSRLPLVKINEEEVRRDGNENRELTSDSGS